jgi:Rrf2 family protein
MIRFSRDEDYSIILINHLSKNYKMRLVPLSEVARKYKISIYYLRNLANILMHAKIIGAVEGKKGGYFLVKNPKRLKIGEVVAIFSKKPAVACCNKHLCDKRDFCETVNEWRKLNENVFKQITSLSFNDFMQYHRQ